MLPMLNFDRLDVELRENGVIASFLRTRATGIIYHCFVHIVVAACVAINGTVRAGAATKIYCAIGICCVILITSPSDVIGISTSTMRMNLRFADVYDRDGGRGTRHWVFTTNTGSIIICGYINSISMDFGIINGNGSTRSTACTANSCRCIIQAIFASIRINSNFVDFDISTLDSCIATTCVSTYAAAAIIPLCLQYIIVSVACDGNGAVLCHVDARTVAGSHAVVLAHHMDSRRTPPVMLMPLPLPTLTVALSK